MTKNEMPAAVLVDLYRRLGGRGVGVWIDGGWGVDALLGEQTRPHGDVDIVVQARDLARLVAVLRARDYVEADRDDTRAWNFVLADSRGHEVDVHVVTFDRDGNGVYGPVGNDEVYPAHAFAGLGRIGGQEVACMSAAYQVANHSGYELRCKDLHDLARLRERFGAGRPRGRRGDQYRDFQVVVRCAKSDVPGGCDAAQGRLLHMDLRRCAAR